MLAAMSMTVAQMSVFMEQIGEESRQARKHELRGNPIGNRVDVEKGSGNVYMPYGEMTLTGSKVGGPMAVQRRSSPSLALERGELENPWMKRSTISGDLFNQDPYLEHTTRVRVPRPLTGPPDKPPSFLYGGGKSGVAALMSQSGTSKGFLPNMALHETGRLSPMNMSASEMRLKSPALKMPLAGVGSNSTNYGLLFPRGQPM